MILSINPTKTQPSSGNKSIALIEMGSGHVECMYSQLLFLKKAGYTVHLICAERLREQVQNLRHVHRFLFLHHGDDFRGQWTCVLAIRRYLKDKGIRFVMFNSGGGNHTRDISLLAPRGTRLAGIVHHTHKLKGSFTQWLISLRVKKNLVLNDYLLECIPTGSRKGFMSVYFIFRETEDEVRSDKKPAEFWVGVPGEVDFRRRAYAELIDELAHSKPDSSIRFVLLGKCKQIEDGLTLRRMLADSNLQHQFILFDDFLNAGTFASYLRQCNVLLPLIHPTTGFFNSYKRYQVSGTYNLSFGFGIPLLMHEVLRGPEDFELSAFFYKDSRLIPLLNRLTAHPDEIASKQHLIRSNPKFSFDYQYERYIRFLEG